ncbi:MAG: Hsp20/alpha crystallin family protein [Paludibacteraceae bacterium]|nr:Hsp20/alpha crystallin family protein [Paludibacteraceae bacterium]
MLLARKSQDFFPTLFNDLFDFNWNGNYAVNAVPQMNIKENDASYEMEFSVPGLTKDDLNISIDQDNNLVVEMTKKTENEKKDDKNEHYLRHEFTSSQFKEIMALPENIYKDKIDAKVENGILKISLPKHEMAVEQPSIKQIEIH